MSSGAAWPCAVCTFVNSGGARQCEMCGQMPSVEQQKVLDPHGWTCAACTFRNQGRSLDDIFSGNAPGGFGHVPSMYYTCQICSTADPSRQHKYDARQAEEDRRREERLLEEKRRAEAEKKRREAEVEKKRARAKTEAEREQRQHEEKMEVFVPLYKQMFYHFSRKNIKHPRSREWQAVSNKQPQPPGDISELLSTILKYSFIDDLIDPDSDSEQKLDGDGDVVMSSSSSSSSSSSASPHKRMKLDARSSSSSSSSSPSPSMCQVCFCPFDDKSPAFVATHCGCSIICTDCIKQYIALRVRDEDISPWIPCPGGECTIPLAPADLVSSGVDRAVLERLCLVHVRKHLARNKDWVACENSKCEFGFIVVKKSSKAKQKCMACRTSQVVMRSCDKADESFNELIKKGELRPCPKCGNHQMKDYGICNVIQCPSCNIWWNWRSRETGRTQREMKQRARRNGSLWEAGELNYQRNLEHTNLEEFKALLERNGQTYDPNYMRGM